MGANFLFSLPIGYCFVTMFLLDYTTVPIVDSGAMSQLLEVCWLYPSSKDNVFSYDA